MLPVHGGGLPVYNNNRPSRQRLEALIKQGIRSGLCGQMFQHSRKWSTQLTMLFFNASYTISTTFYIRFNPISTRQDTISEIDATTEFYLQRLEPCRLITF